MKEEIIKYYPNGGKKYQMSFYNNGNKLLEQYYNLQGNFHRDGGLPDYQEWYENGTHYKITYYAHGEFHNICNPCIIYFFENGKIGIKYYQINSHKYSKLGWKNKIKNI